MSKVKAQLYLEDSPEIRISSSASEGYIWLRLGLEFAATLSVEQVEHLIKELTSAVQQYPELNQ